MTPALLGNGAWPISL